MKTKIITENNGKTIQTHTEKVGMVSPNDAIPHAINVPGLWRTDFKKSPILKAFRKLNKI
jgi:hypothetical protein